MKTRPSSPCLLALLSGCSSSSQAVPPRLRLRSRTGGAADSAADQAARPGRPRAAGALPTLRLLYRLGSDTTPVRPYSQARWSARRRNCCASGAGRIGRDGWCSIGLARPCPHWEAAARAWDELEDVLTVPDPTRAWGLVRLPPRCWERPAARSAASASHASAGRDGHSPGGVRALTASRRRAAEECVIGFARCREDRGHLLLPPGEPVHGERCRIGTCA